MAKYEVISKGIFVKEKGKLRELEIGEIIDESTPHLASKLREVNEKKNLEVATPKEAPPKKTK